MHDGNLLLFVAALPLLFALGAWFAWGRRLHHRFLYAVVVTMAYVCCADLVTAFATPQGLPLDAYAGVREALVARGWGGAGAALLGTWVAWSLGRAMPTGRASG